LVSPGNIYIPGDISSASFFLVAAALVPSSMIEIKNVGINPTRIGILKVLKRMGARITLKAQASKLKSFEPMGDIIVKTSRLKAAKVSKREIPFLIDELPILMVAASMAQGKTLFEGVGELREKETDRIMSMCSNLKRMGADIKAVKVGASEQIVINGVKELKGAKVKSFGDHRTAMSMIVAGLAAKGPTKIDDISCIHKSFPDFLNIITLIIKPDGLG
jgi:3-phosphoshikimate 1-carboxyvinyltransferase